MRWGLVGSGTIVTQFVEDLQIRPESEIVAVYSRSVEKAKIFAQKYDIGTVHKTLEDLLDDDNIDCVYIGVPNYLHKDYVIKSVEAGKHVLCEKPMGINKSQVKAMIDAAEKNRVLLMEGMWTRFFPIMETLREWFANGTLGELRAADISLGYNAILNNEEQTWRFDSKNGFGALMDMGVYCVHFALDLNEGKMPDDLYGVAKIVNGIDYYNSFTMNFGDKIITATSSIVNDTSLLANVYTDKGEICIFGPWWYPTKVEIKLMDGKNFSLNVPRQREGLHYEVAAFEKCVQDGITDCPNSSHENSISAISIMDTLRKKWGVRYPQDSEL